MAKLKVGEKETTIVFDWSEIADFPESETSPILSFARVQKIQAKIRKKIIDNLKG